LIQREGEPIHLRSSAFPDPFSGFNGLRNVFRIRTAFQRFVHRRHGWQFAVMEAPIGTRSAEQFLHANPENQFP